MGRRCKGLRRQVGVGSGFRLAREPGIAAQSAFRLVIVERQFVQFCLRYRHSSAPGAPLLKAWWLNRLLEPIALRTRA
jgi:hypothetical protein